MKSLKTVQEAWSHCLYCPICKDVIRNVIVSTGPDMVTEILSYKKKNAILNLDCMINLLETKQSVKFIINCVNNTFDAEFGQIIETKSKVSKASKPYFYFYFNSVCKKCHMTTSHTVDMDMNIITKNISNIGIEQDSMTISHKKDTFTIVNDYIGNNTLIYRGQDDMDGNPCKVSLTKFDFSNKKKLINKIKTILVFS